MKTKYRTVKQSIKSKILNGTYKPNQKISSESELMKEFGVSRHTVRLALGDLVTTGWLYREQGAGTFCADRTKNEPQTGQVQSKNIAIITTYISDYIFPSIIRGAEKQLSEHGYNVSLFSTNNDHDTEKKVLETILSQHFDGVIVEPTQSATTNPNINYYLDLESKNIPYIMINAFYDELEPISITLDDEKGTYLQTKHLIDLGHKNMIGFFKTDDKQGSQRMKGYLKAHRDYDMAIIPSNIISYNTYAKKTMPLEKLEDILAQSTNDRPTAIICYNDELAVKLLDVIRKRQLNIPNDISIVGFDDSFLANVSEVKLTTIKHPQSELGEAAGKLILDMIKESKDDRKDANKPKSVVFEPELVERNSTKQL